MLAYLVLQVTQRQRSEEPPSVCLALLAILEALHTLAQPQLAVPVQAAARALQGNIYPEVPAQHALQERTQRQPLRLSAQLVLLALIKLPQVRHHVLCALQASMELRQGSLLKLPLVSL